MQLNESNIVEAMENRDLNTLRLDLDLYPKLKQMQPRLDSVIEENYINCKWTENTGEIGKNEYNTGQIVPMDKKCKEILGNIVRPEYSDIEKTMAIYAYIVENIKYDHILFKKEKELVDKGQKIGKGVSKILNGKQSSYNAFMKGEVVCEGYTNMMHYMLSSVGIESKTAICIGEKDNKENDFVDRGEDHSVIRVKTGEDWYYYDPTWDLGSKKLKNIFKTKKEFGKDHTLTFREEEVKEPEIKEYSNKELNQKIKKVVKDQKCMIIEKEERINRNDNKLFRGMKKLYNKFGITREEIEVEKENIFDIGSNDKEMFSKQHQDLNNQKNKEKNIEREEI